MSLSKAVIQGVVVREPEKRFIDNPIKINLVIENFENPLRQMTSKAINNAPKKPKIE